MDSHKDEEWVYGPHDTQEGGSSTKDHVLLTMDRFVYSDLVKKEFG